MTRQPNTLQLTLTWLQALVAIVSIGGSIVFACVEIRLATAEIRVVSTALKAHDKVHRAMEREAARTVREFEGRVSRLEEHIR